MRRTRHPPIYGMRRMAHLPSNVVLPGALTALDAQVGCYPNRNPGARTLWFEFYSVSLRSTTVILSGVNRLLPTLRLLTGEIKLLLVEAYHVTLPPETVPLLVVPPGCACTFTRLPIADNPVELAGCSRRTDFTRAALLWSLE